MSNNERSSGWRMCSLDELPNHFDALSVPDCLQHSHTILCPSDMNEWDPATALEATTFDPRSPGEPEILPYLQGPSPDPIFSLEVARQNIPRSDRPSLPRRRSRYLLRHSPFQPGPTSPASEPQQNNLLSLPIQRWRNSPPQDEAASLSAIYGALQSHSYNISRANSSSHEKVGSSHYRGPPSTASRDSGASSSSILSSTSDRSTISKTTRYTPATSSRRRARAPRQDTNKRRHAADRKFKCTFCCDTFKLKYDWARHEKSLHLNMEEWRCTPNGALVVRPQTGRMHCAYCDMLDPKPDHLNSHNHDACHKDQNTQRVFRRRDYLVQHLRRVHGLDAMPLMEDWKFETTAVVSRCGFCNIRLNTWQERMDHITTHFRNGKTMLDWQGDHGFDASVASCVTNALPPYLIGSEALAPVPFSATNPASIDHFRQISSHIEQSAQNHLLQTGQGEKEDFTTGLDHVVVAYTDNDPATSARELDTVAFADILTRHLSQFARRQMAAGIVPTDDMFQRESRRVLYGDEDDAWNTTVADNADWLKAFRQHNAYERPDLQ